jgi:hypothetical protein
MKTLLIGSAVSLSATALVAVPAAEAHKPAKTIKVSRGATTLKLDAGAADALQAAGVTVGAGRPATLGSDGLVFPITNGRLTTTGFFGTIKHVGAITLTKGTTVVALRNPRIVVAKDGALLSASLGDDRLGIAKLDLTTAAVDLQRRSLKVTGVKATLTKEAAEALNATFGTTLTEGATIGEAAIATRVVGRGAHGGKDRHATKDRGDDREDRANREDDDRGDRRNDDHGDDDRGDREDDDRGGRRNDDHGDDDDRSEREDDDRGRGRGPKA